MWFGIVGFLAWAGGWRNLAKSYGGALPPDFEGRKLRTVTLGRGRFPRVHYRSVLWAEFETDRLLLKPHVLFRWVHPPLIIPRTDIQAAERKGLLRRFCEIKTRAHPGISFHLPVKHFGWPEDMGTQA
ncbi:hypothetical protein [Henriciella sp.]|uniref:hypothetical protein n=1 Tax=Henriciella sp. TaxID=1968823 RepID=UPI002625E432|nr:hypothetical protein [Henriciella sp.]